MIVEYDAETDVLYVKLDYFDKLSHGRQLDFPRTLLHDERGQVVAVEFLVASKGINLGGVPRADEIRDAIRAFRAATKQFADTPVRG